MKRTLYLATLLMLAALAFAPTALAQQGDLDCGDFDFHSEAQTALLQNSSDPNNLDADSDGIACEELLPATPPGAVLEDVTVDPAAPSEATGSDSNDASPKSEDAPSSSSSAKASPRADAEPKAKDEEKQLPNTGGTGGATLLVVGASVLLIAGGILSRKVVR